MLESIPKSIVEIFRHLEEKKDKGHKRKIEAVKNLEDSNVAIRKMAVSTLDELASTDKEKHLEDVRTAFTLHLLHRGHEQKKKNVYSVIQDVQDILDVFFRNKDHKDREKYREDPKQKWTAGRHYPLNLQGIYLCGANLEEASMSNICLRYSFMHKSKLRGAILHGSDLRGVSFKGSTLSPHSFDYALVSPCPEHVIAYAYNRCKNEKPYRKNKFEIWTPLLFQDFRREFGNSRIEHFKYEYKKRELDECIKEVGDYLKGSSGDEFLDRMSEQTKREIREKIKIVEMEKPFFSMLGGFADGRPPQTYYVSNENTHFMSIEGSVTEGSIDFSNAFGGSDVKRD